MTAEQTKDSRQELRKGYLNLLLRTVLFIGFLWILFSQILMLTQVKGNEMFPAIKDGDLLVAYRWQREYVKNDIVVYRVNGERKAGRILARGGDIVMMDDSGTLLLNGTEQTGEILYPTYAKDGMEYPYTVPEGSVFILGDFRTRAMDSRDYGAISNEDVEGKVITLLRRRGL